MGICGENNGRSRLEQSKIIVIEEAYSQESVVQRSSSGTYMSTMEYEMNAYGSLQCA